MLFASSFYLNGNVISVADHNLLSLAVEEIKTVRTSIAVVGGRVVYAA